MIHSDCNSTDQLLTPPACVSRSCARLLADAEIGSHIRFQDKFRIRAAREGQYLRGLSLCILCSTNTRYSISFPFFSVSVRAFNGRTLQSEKSNGRRYHRKEGRTQFEEDVRKYVLLFPTTTRLVWCTTFIVLDEFFLTPSTTASKTTLTTTICVARISWRCSAFVRPIQRTNWIESCFLWCQGFVVQNMGNEFYEITAAQSHLFASEGVIIAGRRQTVTKVMVYKYH